MWMLGEDRGWGGQEPKQNPRQAARRAPELLVSEVSSPEVCRAVGLHFPALPCTWGTGERPWDPGSS